MYMKVLHGKLFHLLYLRLRHALWVVINLVYYRQNARVLDYYLSHKYYSDVELYSFFTFTLFIKKF